MEPQVAYVSSEFALTDNLPIYAGGLGVLAADILYQAADSNIPLVGISIFYREGFFKQLINPKGHQQHFYDSIDPAQAGLVDTGEIIEIPLPDHELYLKVWKKEVTSSKTQTTVPLYLLDGDIPQNRPDDRKITDRLYEKVWAPHLIDDLVLGIGSVRLARKLNLPIKLWHINDDHGGLNIVERIREEMDQGASLKEAREKVKRETLFTTHTPVAGAESKFGKGEFMQVLTSLFANTNADLEEIWNLGKREWGGKELFSLTVFAMRHAQEVNAVSEKHFKVSKDLWEFTGEDVPTSYVTNGVYSPRWTAPQTESIWQKEDIKDGDLKKAKLSAKTQAAKTIEKASLDKKTFDPEALVIAWARRVTAYKQPGLLISDIERLSKILNSKKRPVYVLFSGKAHPEDPEGQKILEGVVKASKNPKLKGRFIYIPEYSVTLAKEILSAADVWLNTPKIGYEASGTSGMKAVLNAALNASTSDGWWVEGFNGKNGWVIEPPGEDYATPTYNLIEEKIIPTYFDTPKVWSRMVKEAYRTCSRKFDTKRMMDDYKKLYGI